jgi:hypothetical protein
MKLFLVTASFAFIIAGCNSGKSKDEAKPEVNKDTAVTVADSKTGNTPKDTAANEADFGGVGDLLLGLSDRKTIELLGQPESKSKAEEWGADGLLHQDWFYKSKGITLNMDNNKGKDKQTIFSITISSPCAFKTNKNVGIGSTYKEVMAAYEKNVDKSASDNKTITVGSVYGGIIFTFSKDDKADTIFIGAAAE